MPTLSMNGVSAHFSEAGTGERVVFLHSGAGEASDWDRVTSAMLMGHRCAALDFYGCGGTPAWPGPAPMTIDDQAELAAALIRELGAPAHLVGHSYGGAIALRLVVTQPDLTKTVSVIEPQCYPLLRELGDPLFEASLSLWEHFRAAEERGEPEHGWRMFIDYYSGDGFFDRLRPAVREKLLATPKVESWKVLFSNPTTIDDLKRTRIPALVLCGGKTTVRERRMCDIISGALPDASLEFIPQAGHMSPMTHSKDVSTRITAHISSRLGAS
ncbi:MAG TPA: alpha/beta hydrolase [Burkholderiaceae bacterium]|nr:alpha/beta hydrolase [Burkholderiaceae bacterium]